MLRSVKITPLMIADVHETHYDPRKIEFESGQPQAILNASKIMPN